VVQPGLHLAPEPGQINRNLPPRPAQRIRQKQYIALGILLQRDAHTPCKTVALLTGVYSTHLDILLLNYDGIAAAFSRWRFSQEFKDQPHRSQYPQLCQQRLA
jgi:hypothetical protein